MASEYYYLENGAQQGPVGQDALVGILTTRLTRDTLVWRDGMADWTPANQVAELAPVLATPAPPPPLPPPPMPVAPTAPPPAVYAPAAVATMASAGSAIHQPSLNPFTVFGRCFSWKGKFNRGEFIVSMLASWMVALIVGVVVGVAAFFGGQSVAVIAFAVLLGVLVLVAMTVAGLGSVVRRVHDLGVSPWLMLLALVPVANFVWMIYLLVAPGIPDAPEEQSVPLAPVAIMLSLVALVFVVTLAAIAIPAFLAARQRAQGIDMQKVTTSVTEGLNNQLSLTMATVTCPTEAHPKKAGDVFECVAIPTLGGRLTIKVVQEDDQGNVKWEISKTDGLLDLQVVERSVVQGLKEQASVDATVTCGGRYRASTPNEVFDCQARTSDGRDAAIAVTITDTEGHVSWTVRQ